MAFFKSLKRAFGFEADELDDDFSEGIDATVTPLKDRLTAPQHDEAGPKPDVDAEAVAIADAEAVQKADEANRQLIFRHAVRLINESLPAFISSAVNPEEQERYLLNALDDGMKQYLADLERRARRDYDDRWAREKSVLDGQFENMREKLRKGEEDGAEAKRQQLSAERQKRALSERVHDLEKQVDSLQAENEQYLLENKSLVNKLRVCAVHDGGVTDAAALEELATLKAEVARLAGEVEARQKQIDTLNLSASQAEATNELSQALVNDLQAKAKEANTRAEEAVAAAEQMKLESDAAREQADELKAQLAKARQQLKVVQEVREQLQLLEKDKIENDNQLATLRETIADNETVIRTLNADLLAKDGLLAESEARVKQVEDEKRRLEDLTDSLRKTIETNLHHQAQSEALLRSEIDRLREVRVAEAVAEQPQPTGDSSQATEAAEAATTMAEPSYDTPSLLDDFAEFAPADDDPHDIANALAVADAEPAKPAPRTRSRREKKTADKPKISAIDESLDSTNWLIATPPSSRKAKAEADAANAANEFGYQEPARRQPPESPAQMLLW